MQQVRTIQLNRSVYEDLDAEAAALRARLTAEKLYLINVMSSPGSGKTTTLVRLVNALKTRFTVGVMEADIDSDVDAVTVASQTGCRAVQLHTGGMCHLDASMTAQGLDGLGAGCDLVFLENVGNLVCPAEFDTGAHMNMSILSVPEGDDKPLKYPLMYEKSDLVLINKIDTLSYFKFDLGLVTDRIHARNPFAAVIPISAKTGEGIEKAVAYIQDKMQK